MGGKLKFSLQNQNHTQHILQHTRGRSKEAIHNEWVKEKALCHKGNSLYSIS